MKFNNFDLKGKVAMITGGARGIGKAITELFAEKNVDIILIDLLEEGKNVARELSHSGSEVLYIQGDVTRKKDLENILEKSLEKFKKIDILVNNAGVVLLDDAENLKEEDWDKTMEVNLKAPFLLSQMVGREMIKREKGKIINIASQAAIVALDNHIAYCSSKAGLIGMTKVLALEWGKYNINVNAICPTVVMTDLGKKAWAGEKGEKMKDKIPIGRFAQPEEIATTALFLASKESDMITGENIVIDGGYTVK